MRDLANHISLKRAISPVSVADNTAVVSQIIDLSGYDKAVFGILIGSIADADATFAVLLQHGNQPNLSDAADVPDSQLIGTEAAAGFKFDNDDQTRKIGYVGPKQYVRLTITPTGNASAALIAAVAILSGSRYSPAA